MGAKNETLKFVLGLKLKQMRLDKGLSLKTLAQLTGLSSSYLNEIEKSKKYPKVDKLILLAQALGVSFEDLVSVKLDKNLDPLEKYLESDFFKELPLEIFGISHVDLYDLMSHSPEKFAAFITTLVEIARSYDLKFEQIQFAALRSYQEMHKNYFPDLERLAQETRERYQLSEGDRVPLERLLQVMQRDFQTQVDQDRLSEIPELRTLRSLYREVPTRQLFINRQLPNYQKAFILGKELGYQILGLKKRAFTSPEMKVHSFEVALNDFRTSYFSGALLLPESALSLQMKNFFKEKTFLPERLQQMLDHFSAGPELFLQRLTQILPQHFQLDQLFFLRFHTQNLEHNHYDLTKELHISQLHNPHGIGLYEHYCRRWITVSLFKVLADSIKRGQISTPVMGAQRSKFFESDREYFCISMALPHALTPNAASCTTIGLLMNDHFKRTVKFWNDIVVPRKDVSQTCERCGIKDCEVRAAPPTLFERERMLAERERAVQNFLKGKG